MTVNIKELLCVCDCVRYNMTIDDPMHTHLIIICKNLGIAQKSLCIRIDECV